MWAQRHNAEKNSVWAFAVTSAFVVSLWAGGIAFATPSKMADGELVSASSTAPVFIEAEVTLTSGEELATVGELRTDGFVYRILPDGVSVALCGWYGARPEGDIVIPGRVVSGKNSYEVSAVGTPAESVGVRDTAQKSSTRDAAQGVFQGSAIVSVTLPSTVVTVTKDAFSSCSSLARIEVAPENEFFASHGGMLFTKDSSSLLFVPEGMEGEAFLPDQTATVPASAFSRCGRLQAIRVGEGSSTFYSENGKLYSKETGELVASLPEKGEVALPVEEGAEGDADTQPDASASDGDTSIQGAAQDESAAAVPETQPMADVPVINEERPLLPAAYLAGVRNAAAPISVTTPLTVTFGDGNGYDVAHPADSVTTTGFFENSGGTLVTLTSVNCSNNKAEDVLGANEGSLETQKLFSLYPGNDVAKAVNFGYGSGVNNATVLKGAFSVEPGSSLECTYRLNLTNDTSLANAKVKPEVADNGASVKSLAQVVYTFEAVPGMGTGTGSPTDDFYLKDNTTNQVYTAAEVKTHAEAITVGSGECIAAYRSFMADESKYTCQVKWGDGTVYDVRIIGINHDERSDGSGKAGLTFQFKNLLNTHASMNDSNTNVGAWSLSSLRQSMNSKAIWEQVPSELQRVIELVKKKYSPTYTATPNDIITVDDKLFLASFCELMGNVPSSLEAYWRNEASWLNAEGYQYEYWSGIGASGVTPSLMTKNYQTPSGGTKPWWTRSVGPSISPDSFSCVSSSGSPSYATSMTLWGVCPCFCL